MSICSVKGCEKAAQSRGVCNTHYQKLRRAGLVPIGTKTPASLEKRFWRHVDKSGDCWIWTAHTKTGKGYGRIGEGGKGGKYLLAHRVSYELHNGPIPDGLVVMHKCDNPRCVNPAHLMLGTTAENIQDAFNKGRKVSPFKKGEAHHIAVLNEEVVRQIRTSPLNTSKLAKSIGCSYNAVRAVRQGTTWKHVT